MSIDTAIISQAVSTYRNGETISDLQAKVIANAWHGGQASALYSFTSTGAVREGYEDGLLAEIAAERTSRDDAGESTHELDALYAYVYDKVGATARGPVDGWSEISW